MESKRFMRSRAIAVVGGLSVVALAAGGVAYATTPTATGSAPTAASTTAATTAGHPHRQGRRGFWMRIAHRTVHAQIIVKTKTGYKTFEIDRGIVASVSSSSISLTRPDGPTVSATITSSTRFRGLPESKIHKGDRVIVIQTGGSAVLVGSRAPKSTSSSTATSG